MKTVVAAEIVIHALIRLLYVEKREFKTSINTQVLKAWLNIESSKLDLELSQVSLT